MGKVLYLLLFIAGSILLARAQENEDQTNSNCEEVQNCNSCINTKLECSICAAGKAMLKSRLGCSNCPADCNECEDVGTEDTPNIQCTECNPGYTIKTADGTCEACNSGCKYCNTTTVCHECYAPNAQAKYFVRKSDGTCHECSSNCQTCNLKADDTTECSKCILYYTVKADKTCTGCPSRCPTCSHNGDSAVCSACDEGYVLDSANNKCLSCPAACDGNCNGVQKTSTTSECTACKAGYYLNNAACDECTGGCATCTSTSVCQSCSTGYLLESDSCTACPNRCDVCERDDQNNLVCKDCEEKYGVVEADLVCIVCEDSNCDACTGRPDQCTDCASGYYIDSNQGCTACSSLHAQCTSCSSATACTACSAGYKESGATCVDCNAGSTGCTVCTADANNAFAVCSTCGTAGYYLDTATMMCVECDDTGATPNGVANCKTCMASTMFTCNSCDDGYLPDASLIAICSQCSMAARCDNCKYADAMDSCDECVDGYFLPSDTDSCTKCNDTSNGANKFIENCAKCTCTMCDGTTADDVTCTECSTGYFTDAAALVCTLCDDMTAGQSNCAECTWDMTNNYACTKCKSGFLPDDASFTNCYAYSGSNCLKASQDNVCSECDAKYYINANSQCSSCPARCAVCAASTGVCSSCEPGNYKNADGECVACSENCDACSDTSGDCTNCATGFTRDDDNPTNCLACDANCANPSTNCDYANSIVTCTTCSTGYARVESAGSNDVCSECPNGCATCPPNADGVLVCATCDPAHFSESGDCGNCPKNCISCKTVAGVITCDSNGCADGYALDASANQCKSCPSFCDECSVNSDGDVLCNDCKEGYGISADKKSCPTCSILTGIANCARCTDADSSGNAECEECAALYTFNDDKEDRQCTACSTFLTDCNVCEDNPWECTSCKEGFSTTDDKLCAHLCVACNSQDGESCVGDFDTRSNSTRLEPCFEGACWAYYNETSATDPIRAYGCYNRTCDTRHETERCDPAGQCARCCTGDTCNTFGLKGMDGGADKIQLGFGLLASILVTALLRN